MIFEPKNFFLIFFGISKNMYKFASVTNIGYNPINKKI